MPGCLTLPPTLLPGPRIHVSGRDRSIERRVPFGGNVGIEVGERPARFGRRLCDGPPRLVALWALLVPATIRRRYIPDVAFRAQPPHALLAGWPHVESCQFAVARRVPFGGRVGELVGEAAARLGRGAQDCAPRDRALVASDAATTTLVDRGLPFMLTLWAFPPGELSAADADLLGGQVAIESRVPFSGDSSGGLGK